ncbi:LexA family protein [Flavobacterium xueshanense]|uniref:LexA family protein n=1 Tax=Flavobacterium xueshanense TaxID=935223 RepID=UPI00142F30D7|nr:S24 family peptidase [Flavobacterium xueshanense]
MAICVIEGKFTVKRGQVEKDCFYLMPENSNYAPIKGIKENQLIIWRIGIDVSKKF